MKPRIPMLFLLLCICSCLLHAQTPAEDSLRTLVNRSETQGEEYVDAVIALAFEIRTRNEEESIELNKRAVLLAQDLNYPRGEAMAKLSLGFHYRSRDQDLALTFTSDALETFLQLNDTVQIITCHYNLRSVLSRKNLPVQALEHNLESLRLAEAINHRHWKVLSHSALARAFIDLEDLESAKHHAEEALVQSAATTNRNALMHVQSALGEIAVVNKDYDSAKHHFRIVYDNAIGQQHRVAQQVLLFQLTNVLFETGQLDSALLCIKKSEELLGEIDDFIPSTLMLRTKLYYLQGNMNEVIRYGTELTQMLEDRPARNEWMEVYPLMGKAYASLGQHQKAYQSSMTHQAYLDSLNNPRAIKQTAKLALQRTLELKQNEINLLSENEELVQNQISQQKRTLWMMMSGLGLLSVVLILLWRNNRKRQQANQNLSSTLAQLKSTQAQLIHSEKMASLGELTAGIAHEIQNPLNFVNNFSDVSSELVNELRTEISNGDLAEAEAISQDLIQNLDKIHHHGSRASSIVQGMLAHSHTGSGERIPTDVNKMVDEYLRLAYHGSRAKDKSFQADFSAELDQHLPLVPLVSQDMGRVILNLINNAFYACAERSRSASAERSRTKNAEENTTAIEKSVSGDPAYKPKVTVSTELKDATVLISVQDNGKGMSPDIIKKIFQPFFTTKPAGEGTGLGLSLSYDIVTKGHGGTLRVESEKGVGTAFVVSLPVNG
ncbi:MAG: hypothetical protein KTR24_12830 [Saprospiraceae bacterium]|nr:hypothetical protein [Saprospiraceae bacterium]